MTGDFYGPSCPWDARDRGLLDLTADEPGERAVACVPDPRRIVDRLHQLASPDGVFTARWLFQFLRVRRKCLDHAQFCKSILRYFHEGIWMHVKTARKNQKVTKNTAIQSDEIDLGWLGGLIGFNLRIAHEASVRAYLQSIQSVGPLAWHFAILALIDLNPGLTQTALARAVNRDSSSLTPVLDDLCDRKLITRNRPDHDRRRHELRITAAGIKSMERLKSKVEAHERELDRLFTREQRALLIRMLKQIASGLAKAD